MTSSLAGIAERASSAGLFMDFDGTLSPIVARPEDARPAAPVPHLLEVLATRLGLVAVVSGRSAHQLAGWLGPQVEIWGLHGAERAIGGRVHLSDSVVPFLDDIARSRDEARRLLQEPGLEGTIVEDKGAIVALHHRDASDPSGAGQRLARIADELARKHGLTVVGGRMVLELRPPIRLTKKEVVDRRARELDLTAAAFIGDDVVDLPGFDALDELEVEGAVCVRVGVGSDEAPAALLDRADVVVDGPAGVVALLTELVELTTPG